MQRGRVFSTDPALTHPTGDCVHGVLAAATVSSIAGVTVAPCTGSCRAPSALALVLPPPTLRRGALPPSTHCLVGAAPRVRRALCALALRIATYATECHPPNRASGRVGR